MSPLGQAEGANSLFLCLFVLCRPSTIWMIAHPQWGGPSAFLSLPTQVLIYPETPSRIHPEIMFNQILGFLVALSSCVTKFIITEELLS